MNGGDDPLWTLGPFNPMIGWCPMQYEPSIPIGVFVFTPITLFQGALPFSLSWVRAQNWGSTPTNQVIRGELATKVFIARFDHPIERVNGKCFQACKHVTFTNISCRVQVQSNQSSRSRAIQITNGFPFVRPSRNQNSK